MTLTAKDYRKLLEIIEISYSISDYSRMLMAVFEKLQRLVPFSSSVFMPLDLRTGHFLFPGHVAFHSPSQPVFLFSTYYAPLHPVVISNKLSGIINTPVRITDVISPSRLLNTEYGCDFQPLTPIFYEVAIALGAQGNPLGGLGIHREKKDHDFSDHEMEILKLLVPHLSRALYHLFLTKDQSSFSETGVVILHSNGQPVYLNDDATRALNGRPPDILADSGLNASPAFFQSENGIYRIRTFLCDLEKDFMKNRRARSNNLRPMIKPVKPHPSSQNQVAKIILLEPLLSLGNIQPKLSPYGLSPRQEEITLMVMRGYSNKDIAQKLYISEQTVKDHLHDIFDKTQVHSRCELIAKILKIPGADK